MKRPLIIGIVGVAIVVAAILLTVFTDRETEQAADRTEGRPAAETAAKAGGEAAAPERPAPSGRRAPPPRRDGGEDGGDAESTARDTTPASSAPATTAPATTAPATTAPATTAPATTAPATSAPAPAASAPSRPSAAAPPTAAPSSPPAAVPPSPAPTDAQTARETEPGPAAPGAPGAAVEKPSFDIVRVNPRGDTVIAGRAAPNAEVTVTMGGEEIGRVMADRRGEWVLVPQTPIPAGSHELEVTSRTPAGGTAAGERNVVIVVPERGKDIAGQPSEQPTGSLALAVPKKEGDAPLVLQTPGGTGDGALSLDAIEYGEPGDRVALSGRAPAGSDVRVYLDNEFIGTATANHNGIWSLKPETKVPAGLYRMRVDQTAESGRVVARIELPFSRAAPLTGLADGTVVFVQPGNSLWRLARAAYGSGLRYTVIYEANRDQIRNPDLIYPGQVFVLPNVN